LQGHAKIACTDLSPVFVRRFDAIRAETLALEAVNRLA